MSKFPNNPVHRFFRDEYADHELERYSDGTLVTMKPSTPELAAGFERITAELEKRGYRKMGRGSGSRGFTFSKPEYCMAAYIGTTVNPFSFNDKIWLWTNQYAISEKCINVYEVFKHNGTAANASLRVSVCYINAIEPKWTEWPWRGSSGVNEYGVEIPKTYMGVSTATVSHGEEIRKFKPNVSDKVLTNILNKAEEVLEKITLVDPSDWEVDASNFHPDTSKEAREAKKASRR
jgi:hypothetical protein